MKGNTIKEHDRIVLKSDLPDEGLKAGDVGTVVHVYRDRLACEVEFTTLAGDTAAVVARFIGVHGAEDQTQDF